MIYLFTSATRNYLPKVRVLASSLAVYHPECHLVIAMADRVPDGFRLEDFSAKAVIQVEELGMPLSWIFQHSIVELSTAIKPFVFRHLFDRKDCEAVVYFDPDMVLYSQLDELFAEFNKNSILLIPHLTKPDVSSVPENELVALQFGTYNLGFLGVKNDANGRQFVDWWTNRLERYCFDDRQKGLFTDQKWVDLVPAMFDGVAILKSSRFDVSSWNAPTRVISRAGNTILVDGEPLGFYHFTGFDSGAHDIALKKGTSSANPFWSLVKEYRKAIGKPDGVPWAYGHFSNGVPINGEHRRLYRGRPDLQRTFPNPFCADGPKSYYHWFEVSGQSRPMCGVTAGLILRGVKLFVANPTRAVPLMRAFWSIVKHRG
ncbi:glycosyl transferase [Chloroflexota bacterium]